MKVFLVCLVQHFMCIKLKKGNFLYDHTIVLFYFNPSEKEINNFFVCKCGTNFKMLFGV